MKREEIFWNHSNFEYKKIRLWNPLKGTSMAWNYLAEKVNGLCCVLEKFWFQIFTSWYVAMVLKYPKTIASSALAVSSVTKTSQVLKLSCLWVRDRFMNVLNEYIGHLNRSKILFWGRAVKFLPRFVSKFGSLL